MYNGWFICFVKCRFETPGAPFTNNDKNGIPPWISNWIHRRKWDVITYPFLKWTWFRHIITKPPAYLIIWSKNLDFIFNFLQYMPFRQAITDTLFDMWKLAVCRKPFPFDYRFQKPIGVYLAKWPEGAHSTVKLWAVARWKLFNRPKADTCDHDLIKYANVSVLSGWFLMLHEMLFNAHDLLQTIKVLCSNMLTGFVKKVHLCMMPDMFNATILACDPLGYQSQL